MNDTTTETIQWIEKKEPKYFKKQGQKLSEFNKNYEHKNSFQKLNGLQT